jgi:FMN phosphatase YigB (HAD superfamily)
MRHLKIDWKRVRVVVFDMDGTLYDQGRLRRLMIGELLNHILSRPSGLHDILILETFRREREKHALYAGGHIATAQYEWVTAAVAADPRQVAAVVETWISNVPLKYVGRCRYPGVTEFFSALADRRIATAILSDYPAEQKMAALGISADLVLCTSQAPIDRFKPDPKGLAVISRELGIPLPSMLLIGDRDDRDGECARRAGIPYLILRKRESLNGFQSFEQLISSLKLDFR